VVPQTLTVLAAIRPGEEARLREILRPIGDDIEGSRSTGEPGRVRMEFTRSRRIHFARFGILRDPDRGPGCERLLYSATYDGDLDSHLAELIAITSDLDAIWGRCQAYSGAAGFGAFIRAHALEPAAFYIAFRDETVSQIQDAIALRRQAEAVADSTAAGPPASTPSRLTSRSDGGGNVRRALECGARAFADGIRRLVRALPIVIDIVHVFVRYGVANAVHAARQTTASLDRYPPVRWVNQLTSNRMPPRRTAYSSAPLDNCTAPAPLVPGDEIPSAPDNRLPSTFREDAVTQNQLTLVTVVTPGQVDRVRAVMAAIDALANRLTPPGSLIGVSTIHFVKWLVIDDGRRLMMVSDYDGSWESYIDEFAEMILSGLDAIWETAYGYPPDGARDVPAFKRFLRSHQVPSEVFFSAYPEETVLNITNDLNFARACADAIGGRPQATLQRR
jgi:hypothetical protein